MAINYQTLRNWSFDEIEHHYTRKDTILYALGVGVGEASSTSETLRFVYEQNLVALPTMAVVLGYPGFWLRQPATGIDWRAVLHVEQAVTIHRPLEPEGVVVGRTRVDEVYDQGKGRGAILVTSREIVDAATGARIASLSSTEYCRGEGGFGGPPLPPRRFETMPERAPDQTVQIPVSPRAALIYRLSGDDNPLHADPAVAKSTGFDRPILHGLCSFGMTGHALVRSIAGNLPHSVTAMKARFTAPVYPTDVLVLEIWHESPGVVRFRVHELEQGVVVIDGGSFNFDVAT
jgi:acyl dehydratase